MDIVDIDKVLDDLELNEDQNAKTIRNESSEPVPNKLEKFVKNNIAASTSQLGYQRPLLPLTNPIDDHLNETKSNTPPIPNRLPKTNFVNVSNVFLSLNEYVNAVNENDTNVLRIEKLEDYTHKQLISTNTINSKLSEKDNTSSSIESSSAATGTIALNTDEFSNLNSSDEAILLISNRHRIQAVPLTEKLCETDSTSSSFESAEIELKTKEINNFQLNNTEKGCSNSLEDPISITNNTATNSSSSIMPATSQLSSNNDFSVIQPNSTSSVSNTIPVFTSDESLDNENNVLNEKMDEDNLEKQNVCVSGLDTEEMLYTDKYDDSITSDDIELDLNEDTTNNEIKNVVVKLENPETNENAAKPESVLTNIGVECKSNDRFIKPICFEAAATMDDVSDTELESYLQELEDLEVLPNGSPDVIKCTNTASGSLSQKSAIESINVIDPETIEREEFYYSNENDSEINPIIQKDDKNADSFSQASTVEFADINGDSDFQLTTTYTTGNNNSNNNNISDIECSDNQNDVNLEAIQDSITVNSAEQFKEDEDKASNDDGCKVLSNEQQSVVLEVTPKRPNTLELSSTFNTDPITSNSIAGSTPANQPTSILLSCSSSDESNIIATEASAHSDDAIQSMDDSGGELVASNEPLEAAMANNSNAAVATNISLTNLGKVQPYWIPDNMALFCMQCNQKFSFIKRRHHCRACGQVLCSTCCSLKAKLEYMGEVETRICIQCDILLNNRTNATNDDCDTDPDDTAAGIDVASVIDTNAGFSISNSTARSPNPNNPMEYCSVIPPHQQIASTSTTPISVMVPVGVLKREGAPPKTARKEKNVMFSDGIRPGCDLTELDNNWGARPNNDGNGNFRKTGNRRAQTPPGELPSDQKTPAKQKNNNVRLPPLDPKTNSYIPSPSTSSPAHSKAQVANGIDTLLPPICVSSRTEFKYADVVNNVKLIERLQNEQLKFIIQRNFYILVKIIKLTCCINKYVINFTTQGMHHVGQDEIVILLEKDSSNQLPKDIFLHLNEIFRDADKGQTITELGFSIANQVPFLGSKEHGGFLFIRTTFQCLQNVIVPENPYLIGILIHRWEVPWAKIFPLRLMLRLGALHRYYPSPHISVRGRNSVYAEIAQTIINFLADFRTYSYTIATIRGMYIHMEDRRTNVLIPKNRYDQIMKAINNSSDHILALAGNFSKLADGHLVCVQNTESGCVETHAYSTQAINIQGKPRKVTGASFLVLNGALKTTAGLSGKCSIVEDGLMVQILPKKMAAIQQSLKTMKDIDIICGPVDAEEPQTEIVSIQWVENDTEFNIGVVSPIDKKPMDGIPSIRVHRGLDFSNSNHIIRWTEVFILKSDDESAHGKDPIDMSKLSEQIARSASIALVTFLDLLAANGLFKLAIRATLDQDQVCYEAGSNYDKLAPLYMNALDNELIPTLHRQATNLQLDQTIIIELIFHILDV